MEITSSQKSISNNLVSGYLCNVFLLSGITMEHLFLWQKEWIINFLHGNLWDITLCTLWDLILFWYSRWEFIQHVLSLRPTRFDEHFKPIYLLCSSCSYDFNYILHYENISVEEPKFVEQLGARGDIFNQIYDINERAL